MSVKMVLFLLVLAALGLFVAANWAAFTTPTVLSLLVATVEAPLGIVMLGITAFVAALFVGYAFYLQGSAMRESRRLAREIDAQRERADQVEASRLAELRSSLETRLDRVAGACSALQQTIGGVAAELAELNQRLDTAKPASTPQLTDRSVVDASVIEGRQ